MRNQMQNHFETLLTEIGEGRVIETKIRQCSDHITVSTALMTFHQNVFTWRLQIITDCTRFLTRPFSLYQIISAMQTIFTNY